MPSCTKLLLSAVFATLFASAAYSQDEYAVKFVCGTPPKTPVMVAPGFYVTAVNVHNPSASTVKFKNKVAVALPNEKGGPISKLIDASLDGDQALEIDCGDIFALIGGKVTFAKGFVVIQSPSELDVITVYTAAASATGTVATMALERAPVRKN